MGKAATAKNKSTKTPVLLYRTFLKISLASILYGVFKILNGAAVADSALPTTLAAASAIAYELAYFIYKGNTDEKRGGSTRRQIIVLTKVGLFFGGVFSAMYGAQLVRSGYYAAWALVALGFVCCQQIHNNKYITSHLSTFFENLGFGFVVIAMELLYGRMIGAVKQHYWVIAVLLCIGCYAISEFCFHFYNIKKHKGDEVPPVMHLSMRLEELLKNVLLVAVVLTVWALLTVTGSVQATVESGIYERITGLLPICISIITAGASLYVEFIKKPKDDRLSFNPKIGKSEFARLLEKRFGADSKTLQALDYVTKTMNRENGYTRYGGEDYYVHPIAVAKILMEHTDADGDTVAAALLHDCIEDLPFCTYDVIADMFGDKIAHSVELLSKKEDVDYRDGRAMKEYLGAISEEKCATLVKIADRMNNNSTMENYTDERKASKTDETRAFFLPLAEKAAKTDRNNASFYELALKFFAQDVK